MTPPENKTWLPVLLIAGALATWGILLALGAYLAPGDAAAGHDYRKLWVVAGMVGGFLLLWSGVLWAGARRVRRIRGMEPEPEGEQNPRRTPE